MSHSSYYGQNRSTPASPMSPATSFRLPNPSREAYHHHHQHHHQRSIVPAVGVGSDDPYSLDPPQQQQQQQLSQAHHYDIEGLSAKIWYTSANPYSPSGAFSSSQGGAAFQLPDVTSARTVLSVYSKKVVARCAQRGGLTIATIRPEDIGRVLPMQYPRLRRSSRHRYEDDDDEEEEREGSGDEGVPGGWDKHTVHEVCLLPPTVDQAIDWLEGSHAASKRTWAAVVFDCATEWIATEVARALEAVRVRYLNSVPTRPLREERGALDRAEVLQHHAKQYIAARGYPVAATATTTATAAVPNTAAVGRPHDRSALIKPLPHNQRTSSYTPTTAIPPQASPSHRRRSTSPSMMMAAVPPMVWKESEFEEIVSESESHRPSLPAPRHHAPRSSSSGRGEQPPPTQQRHHRHVEERRHHRHHGRKGHRSRSSSSKTKRQTKKQKKSKHGSSSRRRSSSSSSSSSSASSGATTSSSFSLTTSKSSGSRRRHDYSSSSSSSSGSSSSSSKCTVLRKALDEPFLPMKAIVQKMLQQRNDRKTVAGVATSSSRRRNDDPSRRRSGSDRRRRHRGGSSSSSPASSRSRSRTPNRSKVSAPVVVQPAISKPMTAETGTLTEPTAAAAAPPPLAYRDPLVAQRVEALLDQQRSIGERPYLPAYVDPMLSPAQVAPPPPPQSQQQLAALQRQQRARSPRDPATPTGPHHPAPLTRREEREMQMLLRQEAEEEQQRQRIRRGERLSEAALQRHTRGGGGARERSYDDEDEDDYLFDKAAQRRRSKLVAEANDYRRSRPRHRDDDIMDEDEEDDYRAARRQDRGGDAQRSSSRPTVRRPSPNRRGEAGGVEQDDEWHDVRRASRAALAAAERRGGGDPSPPADRRERRPTTRGGQGRGEDGDSPLGREKDRRQSVAAVGGGPRKSVAAAVGGDDGGRSPAVRPTGRNAAAGSSIAATPREGAPEVPQAATAVARKSVAGPNGSLQQFQAFQEGGTAVAAPTPRFVRPSVMHPPPDPSAPLSPAAAAAKQGPNTMPRMSVIAPTPAAAAAPTAEDGMTPRRCKWCQLVAPETHDKRCMMRRVSCKECGEAMLQRDWEKHPCKLRKQAALLAAGGTAASP